MSAISGYLGTLQTQQNLLQTKVQTRIYEQQLADAQAKREAAIQKAARDQFLARAARELFAEEGGTPPPTVPAPEPREVQDTVGAPLAGQAFDDIQAVPSRRAATPGALPQTEVDALPPRAAAPTAVPEVSGPAGRGFSGNRPGTIRNQAQQMRDGSNKLNQMGALMMMVGDFTGGRSMMKDAASIRNSAAQAEHTELLSRRDELRAFGDVLGGVTDQGSFDQALALARHAGYDTSAITEQTGGQWSPRAQQAMEVMTNAAMSRKQQLDVQIKLAQDARQATLDNDLLRHRRVMEGFSQQRVGIAREGLESRKGDKPGGKGKGIGGSGVTESDLRQVWKEITSSAKENPTLAALKAQGILPEGDESPEVTSAKAVKSKGFMKWRAEMVKYIKETGVMPDSPDAIAYGEGAVVRGTKESDDAAPEPKAPSVKPPVTPPETDLPTTPEVPAGKYPEAALAATMKKYGMTREQVLAELARREAAARGGQ